MSLGGIMRLCCEGVADTNTEQSARAAVAKMMERSCTQYGVRSSSSRAWRGSTAHRHFLLYNVANKDCARQPSTPHEVAKP